MASMAGKWQALPFMGSYVLLAAVVLGYSIQLLHAGQWSGPDIKHLQVAGNIGYLSLSTEPWRLLTSVFMHGGWTHMLMNVAFLAQVGLLVESLFGTGRFLLIFLAGGVLAALGSAVGSLSSTVELGRFGPMVTVTVSVGASGALMAMCSALVVWAAMQSKASKPVISLDDAFKVVLPAVGLTLAQGLFIKGIDQVAHVVGLLVGAVRGALAYLPEQAPSLLRRGLAWLGVPLVTALAVGMAVPSSEAYEIRDLAAKIERERAARAAAPAPRPFGGLYLDQQRLLDELMRKYLSGGVSPDR